MSEMNSHQVPFQPLFRNHHIDSSLYRKPFTMLGQFSPVEAYTALSPTPPWSPAHQLQPFRFRSRTEPIDWRRLSALDVDRVAREIDVSVLQDFIMTITFCAVDGERCPNCRGPADPSLIKLLRMSQLSTEYLLHCQDFLSTQLSGLEERLQAALSQVQRGEEQRAELEKNLQETKLENRRRKKLISTQQLLLQASANNYHKCQFCEKSFVNYSYLQAHVQRRHPEITDAERQKKKKVEQMEDGIEELKERLRLTQMQLQAERETDSLRRQQEHEEQQRREQSEKEALERWKEEERRKFQQEIGELRQLFLQESKDMASKSSSIEAKLLLLQNKEEVLFNNISLQEENDPEKEMRENRERKLKEIMARKKSEWKKKFQEAQNRHQQEQEELKRENARLLKALSVEKNSGSSLKKLQRQVVSLSSQLSQKDRLIKSQEEKIKKLSVKPVSVPVVSQNAQDSPEEPEEEGESLDDSDEPQSKVVKSHKGKSELMRESRPILEESLEEKLENMGLRKGTKGISKQTFKSLSTLLTGQRLQRYRQQPDLQNHRDNLVHEVTRRVKSLQKSQGKLTPSTSKQRGKKNSTPMKEKRLRSREGSKPSIQKARSQQPKALFPTPTPRSKAPPQNQTPKTLQKKNSTPPFSSDEDESVEDSAYITSSRGKPSPSVRLVQSGSLLNPTAEPDWSDSELSEVADTPKLHKAPNPHGSVVQTLTRSLERQLSTPVKKPVGGTRVLPPSSPSSRPAIVKQRALSDEESDLELSSIEELTANRAGVRKSSEVGGTSGTSAWSSAASRPGAW
ncbi:cilium assembly protein DZIP1L isoform X2 [Ctenopharyngodon idella]|uniref:cilium assembly protein DZIP1L isoform X2 n=1 Tax=Ctenopharyngodon idella TaxID=7959 RepID=UPI0022317FEC|nr:cilium assembly protein DZIP1L isoform X2 [Ctenopharyngodon idella]